MDSDLIVDGLNSNSSEDVELYFNMVFNSPVIHDTDYDEIMGKLIDSQVWVLGTYSFQKHDKEEFHVVIREFKSKNESGIRDASTDSKYIFLRNKGDIPKFAHYVRERQHDESTSTKTKTYESR